MKVRAIVLVCILAMLLTACARTHADLSADFSEAEVIAEGTYTRGYRQETKR